MRAHHPNYHCAPVAPFGDPSPQLLIVGLAPGKHGANASGRPFTGDFAGILLYRTLYDFGFSSAPESHSVDDGLTLRGCRVTNAVKCLPPENRPTGEEIRTCNSYLRADLDQLPGGAVVLALGAVAHSAVVRALGEPQRARRFAHGAEHTLADLTLLDCYHCSRYNTQTRRLTAAMFTAVFERVQALVTRSSDD